MSSNDYQPSSWMRKAFGASSADVAVALARAATTAQTDGHEAKAGSRLSTNEPYGATTWLAFAHETATELEAVGAEVLRPARCRYRVGIIEGTLVLAVKLPASTKGVETMSIESAIRQRILRLASVNGDSTLDFGDDYEFTDSDGHVVTDAEFGTAARTVLVVMEGDARSGVEHLHIGDVRVDGTGAVLWVHHEELPTTVTATSDAGLVALELDPATDSFAAGSVPPMTLGLVADEADETGTEGSDDGF
ncbi:hypothetical protein [Rathayibacter sp. AY1E2]|uniref:hypothetical protein n=1 Tax=Rathayibacter sp. AY1E2 TaxID=2080550 RepID=UPI000CE78218|nr:hypothetical protein [Rathayibacter sp. AY1E2]PPH53124.1 hypothetical protein C5C49_05965 [Rathayibacter sp. AY1E2]